MTAPAWAIQDTLAGMAEDLMLGHAALLATRVVRADWPRAAGAAVLLVLPGQRSPTLFPAALAVRAHRGLPRASLPAARGLLALRRARSRCSASGPLAAMLGYLVAQVPVAQRAGHLARLAGRFMPGMSLAARVAVMAQLLPDDWRGWFGSGVRALERTRIRRHRRRMRGEGVVAR
jgi:hypothetical protein